MNDINYKLGQIAKRYFSISETAEKTIHEYQDLKLNIRIPLKTRSVFRQGIIRDMSYVGETQSTYQESVELANKHLLKFQE